MLAVEGCTAEGVDEIAHCADDADGEGNQVDGALITRLLRATRARAEQQEETAPGRKHLKGDGAPWTHLLAVVAKTSLDAKVHVHEEGQL